MSYLMANTYGANTADTTVLRAYGGAISGAFANSGWTKASDAGQIDFTTVTGSNTTGTLLGSEIWHMNDALQNTYPVYVKMDYYVHSTSTPRPGFQITVGTGASGNLTLTGVPSYNVYSWTGSQQSAVQNCYFCGDTNRIIILMWTNTYGGGLISIERTHDTQGNDTGEGVLFCTAFPGATTTPVWTSQYYNFMTGGMTVESSIGTFIPANSLTGVGDRFHFYPVFLSKGVFANPCLNLVVGCVYQFQPNIPATITHYGASHTYLPIPLQTSTNRCATGTNFYTMIRWE